MQITRLSLCRSIQNRLDDIDREIRSLQFRKQTLTEMLRELDKPIKVRSNGTRKQLQP